MRILLSGSHGLIGGALAEDLLAEGHGVVPLVRGGAGGATGGPGAAWDPQGGSVDRDAVERQGPYDAVVHLAGAGLGEHRWSAAYRREILDSRVRSTETLAALVAGLDPVPDVLVCASAVGVYGDRHDEVLTEDSAPGTGFLADVCRAWEAAADRARPVTRVVHLRSGVVLSPRGGALAKQLPLFRLGVGGRLGSGRQYLSWISLEDEVAVIRRVLRDEALIGAVNATAPTPVTNAELTRALGRAVHRPALLAVPAAALSVALGPQMAQEMLLGGQRALPARLAAAGHSFAHPDVDLALTAMLGAGR